ncbi:leucyl aminopeptidase family protein [Phytoactinopolyspora mesophila]|uniref:Probable cytosol aminopeptidase n=1 Tax=Phytoactinopolyspora mesophila TaxID=2650750 RepID=A0A7K3M8V6_9ACTN|nr:leucyl aminopeptidase family protein [Phytoactinopolyspora mesophila]NDL59745.1 leucyl aminopeptidase [Phytoactinopolyspora mesophila]
MGGIVLDENPVRPTAVEVAAEGLLDVAAEVVAVPVWPADTAAEAVQAPASGADPDDGAGGSGPWIGPGGAELVDALGLDPLWLMERENASGRAGEIVSIPIFDEGRGASSADGETDVTRVLLVGLGDGSPASYRKAGAALARAVRGVNRLSTTVAAGAEDDSCVRAFVEGVVLATFSLGTFRSKPGKPPLITLVLAGLGEPASETVRKATTVASASWYARELVHMPSNVKDPAWLAERAEEIGHAHGMDVYVRDEKKLAAEGFGGLVAVGMGSSRPPRLIALRYEPPGAPADVPHVVLAGKGITFDSGGLSLKKSDPMATMKTDMSGAAVVMGVLSAVRELGVAVRVTGLVAAAENMPGRSAQRPSDVIMQYDGTTVEVLNTDAEGRLVLADAIAYAVAELEPSVVVDVATLTGAAATALGRSHAALYSTDDTLADDLLRAGEESGERMWRLPLVDDYRQALKSEVADIGHIDTAKMGGGSIIGALFLERFAKDVPWAHLDIAGVGRADKNRAELVKGGTAFGVRALLTWLESHPAK